MPSSVIHGMLYLPRQQALVIVFRGEGEAYRYFEVTPVEWAAFRHAPSKGTYLNHTFKAKHPRFELIRRGEPLVVDRLSAGEPRDLPDSNVWGFYEDSLI